MKCYRCRPATEMAMDERYSCVEQDEHGILHITAVWKCPNGHITREVDRG